MRPRHMYLSHCLDERALDALVTIDHLLDPVLVESERLADCDRRPECAEYALEVTGLEALEKLLVGFTQWMIDVFARRTVQGRIAERCPDVLTGAVTYEERWPGPQFGHVVPVRKLRVYCHNRLN